MSFNIAEKHIHFNEDVEQCMALETMSDEDEDIHQDNRDSDAESFMMKSTNKSKLPPVGSRKASPRTSVSGDSKTIVILPSTTLKYEDIVKPSETVGKHTNAPGNSELSKASLLETLPPLQPSTWVPLESFKDDGADIE